MIGFLHDLRAAVRGLRAKPSFVSIALVTLAVSLGAAAAMFSVVHAYLFSTLPYPQAQQLALIWQTFDPADGGQVDDQVPLSNGAYSELRQTPVNFAGIAAFLSDFANVTAADEPRRLHVLAVTEEFFSLLGVRAAHGRTLGPQDALPEASRVMVISYGLWQGQYGGDPDVLGQFLATSGRQYEIVGVLPAGFRFTESLVSSDPSLSQPVDAWTTLRFSEQAATQRGRHNLRVIGRLRGDVGLQAAEQQIAEYARWAAQQYPDTDQAYGMRVVALREQLFGHLRPALLSLWAATGFVLLIACANLATLLLAQGQAAQRAVAIRRALGASRWRIARQAMLESLVVALAGGLLALLVAYAAVRLTLAASPIGVFHNYPPEIAATVAVVTLVAALAAGLLFGLLPALRASSTNMVGVLRQGTASLSRRARWVFLLLVAAQVALSITLLIGSALSAKSFLRLMRADLGFDLERVVTFDLYLPFTEYRSSDRRTAFLHELLREVEALPGVESAGVNFGLPLSGVDPSNGFEIDGQPPPAEGVVQSANLGFVSPRYFEAMGIPIVRGRAFLESDTAQASAVAVIDERMAERYFAGSDPLGRQLRIGGSDTLTIVGVVGAVRRGPFENSGLPDIYQPAAQRSYRATSVAIKTRLENPTDLSGPLHDVVRRLDPQLPISDLSTLQASYRQAIAPQRFSLALISAFAALALFLTLVGTYGVLSFLSRLRRREAGVRLALGAQPKQVFGLVLRQGLGASLTGAVLGIALAVALRQGFASLVHDVGTFDPLLFAAVPLLVVVLTCVIYLIPARSLSRVEPSQSLRDT